MELKIIRQRRGLSQKKVADYLNCSPVVYSRYETGAREPSIDILLKLADFFETSVDAILGREERSVPGLTQFEMTLLTASRNADERARHDALDLLCRHIDMEN